MPLVTDRSNAHKTPMVSVVTPCYNSEKYLRETLESVIRQTRLPLEVIVIDDGSTDDSVVIAESFGSPVRVVRQQRLGGNAARNRGIREARGEYLLFLDSDDLLGNQAIESLEQQAGGGDRLAIPYMRCASFQHDPAQYSSWMPPAHLFPRVLRSVPGPMHFAIYHRDLVAEIGGFDEQLTIGQDWDFLLRIALAGGSLRAVDYLGAYYRNRPDSLSKTVCGASRFTVLANIVAKFLEQFISRPTLVEEHGEQAFWHAWAILCEARQSGVTWGQLKRLSTAIERLSAEPSTLKKCMTSCGIRMMGARSIFNVSKLISAVKNQRLSILRRLGVSIQRTTASA